jgi:hypothetical protein
MLIINCTMVWCFQEEFVAYGAAGVGFPQRRFEGALVAGRRDRDVRQRRVERYRRRPQQNQRSLLRSFDVPMNHYNRSTASDQINAHRRFLPKLQSTRRSRGSR